jgi:hypothetical protein
MWKRRRVLQTGLAALLSAAAPLRAFSQPKPRVKIRYNEVVRSVLYAPAYVAITKGYFEELGMDVTLATAQGGDKSVAIMLSNQADIGLIGPESAIYVQNSDSPVKIPIFCGLTATDGFMLVGREELAVARLLKGGRTQRESYPRQAYYHVGQAVEFALKAIYLRRRQLNELPDDLRTARGHDLKLVAELAGLGADIKQLQVRQKTCHLNWLTARDWQSNARFPGNRRSAQEMNDLYTAVGHRPDGIMLWLETIFQKS